MMYGEKRLEKMTDFEDFVTEPPPIDGEADPAADFLERERHELGELAEDGDLQQYPNEPIPAGHDMMGNVSFSPAFFLFLHFA